MVNARHKEVLKTSTSKGAELSASDAKRDDRNIESSSSSKDLNFRGFTNEEIIVLSAMIRKKVKNTIKNVMPYYISQTIDNIKEIVRKELEEFKRTSTRWLVAVEGAFRTSNCKEKNKVNYASNFLRDSAKIWARSKACSGCKSSRSGNIIYEDGRKGDFKLCTVMKAKKYLSHSCQAFMAHVIDTSFEKKSETDVLIVNEFLDVFPQDLSGIPSERQVEFRIDLIPGATPIAKTSYRLAPSEMKELMSQLQELLDKGKANVVAAALSQKEREKVTRIHSLRMIVTSNLFERIKAAQVEALKEGNWKSERIVNVKELLLEEAYKSKYSIHPGATQMYLDLKRNYRCPGMKRNCVKCVEKCLTCIKVKDEHQKPYGKIQPLEIPVWKREKSTMDFVTKLPKMTKKHDAIWVIVDRLTKSAHFIPIRENMPIHKLAKSMLKKLSHVMKYPFPLFRIETYDLLLTFGEIFKKS
nr:hypothetical protein [Tanacetum cinerariifolium]